MSRRRRKIDKPAIIDVCKWLGCMGAQMPYVLMDRKDVLLMNGLFRRSNGQLTSKLMWFR